MRNGHFGFLGKTNTEIHGVIWTDVLLVDEVLPEASLPNFSLQSARVAVKEYISSTFNHLLLEISDALTKVRITQKEGTEQEYSLQAVFEASKKTVIQGSIKVLQDFQQLLDENPDLLFKLRELTIDWVREGFQDFFTRLDDHFLLLSGKRIEASQDVNVIEGMQGEKIAAGLVLVLAQLFLFIEQNAIPIITEEIATSFSGVGVQGFDSDPAFVPAEICRIFRSSGEILLNLYINMRTQKISVLLKRRFTAPNWVKHKKPREVHMSVDLLLQELEEIRNEVKQILAQGVHRNSETPS